MKLIFALMMLFTSLVLSAQTLEWGDLEMYQKYTLRSEIKFDSGLTFKPGATFEMFDAHSEGAPIIYMQFHFDGCTDPYHTEDVILVNPSPEDTTRDRSIGVQLEEGCNLGVFVEPADYYSPSIFESGRP